MGMNNNSTAKTIADRRNDRPYAVTALGEMIDFAPAGKDTAGDRIFARKAGGAPVNLLATVAKAGFKTAFIGKVGNDMFGRFLRETLCACGISDRGLCVDSEHNTTLAFVELNENGDRDFSFCRRYGADVFLQKSDIDENLIKNSALFHFGSLSLTAEPARSATEYALRLAKDAGCVITYDPNYRAPLWSDADTAVRMMKKHLDKVDILKISGDELAMLFGEDKARAVREVKACGVRIILVTNGKDGAELYMDDVCVSLPAEPVKTVDTTGAGDIFFGTFLREWIKHGSTPDNITPEQATAYLKKAIHIAGISTGRYGAIAFIPEEERNEIL